jgi:hypothetical protein
MWPGTRMIFYVFVWVKIYRTLICLGHSKAVIHLFLFIIPPVPLVSV